MTDWSAGYVADIAYTYGYYAELNPLRARLAFLNAGLAPPEVATACELGYGQGMSVNLHAAASPVRWFGTDFNPSQAGFAQELARAADAGAALYDQSFAEFAARADLPEFDYIGLHGIWSWISDENRAVIVDFIRRKLKVGGVLYISYNTQPGWAAFAPLRELLTEHAEVMGAAGVGIVQRIDGALAFAERLVATQPLYARANPQIAARLEKIKTQDRHYLAHEYFNRDWQPMTFAVLARWLKPAKLDWAASAHFLDALDAIHLSAEQQALLQGIPDPLFRQLARDFCVNQQFRRDYWVKGARRLSALEQAEALRGERFVLVVPRGEVSLKVTGSLGEASLQEAIYAPILDALAEYKPRTLGQLENALAPKGIGFAQLREAALALCGAGILAPAQDETAIAKAKKPAERLNAHLMTKAKSHNELAYLASPVTGGGVPVSRFEQLFLLARSQGHKTPQDWAQSAWTQLAAQGQRLVKEGKPLETPEDNLAELTKQASQFAEKRLPVLKGLGVG